MILFVASMEAKIINMVFEFFKFKTSDNLIDCEPMPNKDSPN